MPFINGIWVDDIKPETDPIIITPSMVAINHTQSFDSGGDWVLHFSTIIYSAKYNFNDPATRRRIDKPSLKKALAGKIRDTDKPYFSVKEFTGNRVVYVFHAEKWLKDAMTGIQPRSHLSKFEKAFSFKKSVPTLIMNNQQGYFDKFIIRKFKKVTSDRKFDGWFKGFLTRELDRKIKQRVENMFDYSYDFQTNKMVLRLKTVYILGILYAVGETADAAKNNRQPFVKIDFTKKVKGKAKNFNRQKWESYIKRKFI